jgi:hypothetical protein
MWVEEQWRWGSITKNNRKTSMLTKDDDNALKQKGMWMGQLEEGMYDIK